MANVLFKNGFHFLFDIFRQRQRLEVDRSPLLRLPLFSIDQWFLFRQLESESFWKS